MAWKYIPYLWIALTTASAYRQIRYSDFIYPVEDPQPEPTIHRRIDTGDIAFYDRPDRAQNERSIPFRSNSQRLQPVPRNGNMSLRVGNTKPTFKRDNPVSSDSVVFPGLTSRSSMFVPEIPTECDINIGICEHIPNYPQQHVDELLSTMTDLKYRFNLDVETPEIAQRRGSDENNEEMCPSNKTIIYPKAAKNIQGNWVFVVNRDGKPVQGFKAEVCMQVDHACKRIAYVSNGYNATCHQKSMERTLWSIDENGKMVLETIPMPTCCSCIVKSIVKE